MEREHIGLIRRVEMVKEVKEGLVRGEGRLQFVVVGVEKGEEVWLERKVEGLPRREDHQFVKKVETLDVQTGLEFDRNEF